MNYLNFIFILSLFFGRTLISQEVPMSVEQRPNILIVLTDDLGYGDLGCYGAQKIKTPNIDSLTKGGVRYKYAYAPSSVCSPTRYGVMTGRYDWRTEVQEGVIEEDAPLHIEKGRPTLGTMMKSKGYQTAYFGKWHLGLGDRPKVDWNEPFNPGPLEVGFDYFYGMQASHQNMPRIYIENHDVANRAPGEKITLPGGRSPDFPTLGVTKERKDEEVGPHLTEKIVSYLEKNAQQKDPFFIFYGAIEPHVPITPHSDFIGKSECGAYGDFVQQLDSGIGKILKKLEEIGKRENTIIIFTSDNGGLFVENPKNILGQTFAKGHHVNGGLRGRKHGAYEGGIRIPLIVQWPQKKMESRESDRLISLVDIFSSLATVVGHKLELNEAEDSVDQSKSFFENQDPTELRPPLISCSSIGLFVVREGNFKYIEERKQLPPGAQAGVKRKDGHILNLVSENKTQLYNVVEDPYEKNNIAESNPEIIQTMQKVLDRYRKNGRTSSF